MKDINKEMELLARVLPDIEPGERRRRLLFWTERSRHHIENLSKLCQWIMKYQPTLDAIDQMYKRIKCQRTSIESSFKRFELTASQGWQQWSRAPDMMSSISVLKGHGSFPFLPSKIFTIDDGLKKTTTQEFDSISEYEQLRYERVVQRKLISEKVPAGGRLVCSLGGLVELSSPSMFVAFLVLKTGSSNSSNTKENNDEKGDNFEHIWEVKGVEVLLNGVLDYNRVNCPSEKDLEKLTVCANSVAYRNKASSTDTAIERIYYCLSTLVSSIAMKILEAQVTNPPHPPTSPSSLFSEQHNHLSSVYSTHTHSPSHFLNKK
jgi:hypothetical protein